MDKLKQAKASTKGKTSITTTSRTSIETEYKENKRPPKDAIVLSKEIRKTVEEIENGWLTITNIEIRWREKDNKDSWGNYYNETKKVYSQENPMPEVDEDDEIGVAELFD